MPDHLLPLVCPFLALATPLGAQNTGADAVTSLRGIRTISVAVEKPNADALRAGMTAARIETGVTALLREGGVQVLPTAEGARIRAPYLYVELNPFTESAGDDPPMIHMAQVEFDQRACLEHTRATWSTAQAGRPVARAENYRPDDRASL